MFLLICMGQSTAQLTGQLDTQINNRVPNSLLSDIQLEPRGHRKACKVPQLWVLRPKPRAVYQL